MFSPLTIKKLASFNIQFILIFPSILHSIPLLSCENPQVKGRETKPRCFHQSRTLFSIPTRWNNHGHVHLLVSRPQTDETSLSMKLHSDSQLRFHCRAAYEGMNRASLQPARIWNSQNLPEMFWTKVSNYGFSRNALTRILNTNNYNTDSHSENQI